MQLPTSRGNSRVLYGIELVVTQGRTRGLADKVCVCEGAMHTSGRCNLIRLMR